MCVCVCVCVCLCVCVCKVMLKKEIIIINETKEKDR